MSCPFANCEAAGSMGYADRRCVAPNEPNELPAAGAMGYADRRCVCPHRSWVDPGGLLGKPFIPLGPAGSFSSHIIFAASPSHTPSPVLLCRGRERVVEGGTGDSPLLLRCDGCPPSSPIRPTRRFRCQPRTPSVSRPRRRRPAPNERPQVLPAAPPTLVAPPQH